MESISDQGKFIKAMERIEGPFFHYDLDVLNNHLEYIDSIIHPDIKLWYACKANPMSAVLKVLRNRGFGVDVASLGELTQALNVGLDGENLISTGPAKSKKYLTQLLKNGVRIFIIESFNQLKWLNELAEEKDYSPQVLLRVQLEWAQGKSVLGGNDITPFGLGIKDWEELKTSSYPHLIFKGFHAFQWGNILELDHLKSIWHETVKQILPLAKKLQIRPEIIDLGGGVGIPYKMDQKLPDFKQINDYLIEIKKEYNLDKLWLELGRYTVGSCGKYFTQIIDKKTVRGKNILVTEGGINHIARSALTGEAFPCTSFNPKSAKESDYSIHGPLCTSLDKLGEFSLPEDLEVGDWLVFHQTGAYGYTESLPYFLCHDQAAEVISYKGDLMIPRYKKTPQEWMI